MRRSFSIVTNDSKLPLSFIRIYIVGSGPSVFYLTQNLVIHRHRMPETTDIIERSSLFLGCVQYIGVAPDHSEVINIIQIFTTIAEHEHVRELQGFYHTIRLWFTCST
ncbi:unnamed protein product [Rotaria sordida]|uniref:Uncharacterized protein n=1 Tax=Rotaria sordida TaxID=392033 RepID=A0A819CXH1_9BILA|nr:unnamed protein product [Rotaria sordida]CAF1398090.1 unnamed protein product [Rotaria sordida]CAF1475531.1 unnamed protein product [Rotaria sordida]CAF3819659.1 unnamed protein product [Rotaria sordida]CAF3998775.1 unnamed protein product [Rotaria sordida]